MRLVGAAPLPASRLARPARELERRLPGMQSLIAREVYFLDLDRALSPDEIERACELLQARAERADGTGAPWDPEREIMVVPRAGTRSPWSSKATDILRGCGLHAVRRVERSVL
jgi:phosphoribosylformylglycinamidine synthase